MEANEQRAAASGGKEHGPEHFATTRWSVILASALNPDATQAAALEELCRIYWRPVFAYLCRRGRARADAQDLTQDFFVHILTGSLLHSADPTKGRFRSYLLTALEHTCSDARDRAHAHKRGGDRQFISLDEFHAEASDQAAGSAATDHWTPRHAYEVRWAQSLLAQALARLRDTLAARGRPELYEVLHPFLDGAEPAGAYGRAAAELQLSPEAVKVAIHRLRSQYRTILRGEVARTVDPAGPGEIEEELRHLAAVLSSRTGS